MTTTAGARLRKIHTGGLMATRLMFAVTRLGIPDLLKDGPRSAEELAKAAGANADAIHRVMRALSMVVPVFTLSEGKFALTELGQALRRDVPDSCYLEVLMAGEFLYAPFSEIVHTLKTGEPGFDKVYGERFFDRMKHDPKMAGVWDASMAQTTAQYAAALAGAVDYSRFKKVMDVGGGLGVGLAAILKKHPHVQGILLEMPHIVDRARAYLESQGVADRCEVVAGDIFEAVPTGADAYITKAILHDWNDEDCHRILAAIRKSIPPHAKYLVVERLIRDVVDEVTIEANMTDMLLLTTFGGRVRSEEEFRAMFARAGFELKTITPAGVFFVLESDVV